MDQILSPNPPEIRRMPDMRGLTKVWYIIREKMIFCLILFPVLFFFQNASAQRYFNSQSGAISPWEIGVSGGVSFFMNSVNPEQGAETKKINYWSREANPGFGLAIVRNISPAFGIELNLLTTRLSGTWDESQPAIPVSGVHDNPLTFDSRINQFDLMMAFNINQMMLPGDEDDIWHIYIKPGVGITHITDKKEFFPGDSPSDELSLVLDGGVSVSVNDKLKVMLGSAFRGVNSDNLDGVHLPGLNQEGKAVSNKVYELYNFSYLRLSYSFGDFNSNKSWTLKKKTMKYRSFRRR